MIVDASSSQPVSMANRCNKYLVSIHQVSNQTLHHQSITQMVIRWGGKSHRVAVWQTQALQLKIRDSHLTCKVANKCVNVRERVEVVEWNKRLSPPPLPLLSCESPVSVKKTLIEKNDLKNMLINGKLLFLKLLWLLFKILPLTSIFDCRIGIGNWRYWLKN